jgi:hypothetical protein
MTDKFDYVDGGDYVFPMSDQAGILASFPHREQGLTPSRLRMQAYEQA